MEDSPLTREVQAMQKSVKTTTFYLVDVKRNVSDIYKRLVQVEGDVLYLKAGSSFFPVEGGRELKLANSSIKELRAELRNMMNLVAALTNRVAQLEEQGRSKNYDDQSPSMSSCSEDVLYLGNICGLYANEEEHYHSLPD